MNRSKNNLDGLITAITNNNDLRFQRASSSYGARSTFGERERSVRDAQGAAESSSSFLSSPNFLSAL